MKILFYNMKENTRKHFNALFFKMHILFTLNKCSSLVLFGTVNLLTVHIFITKLFTEERFVRSPNQGEFLLQLHL